MKQNEGRKVVTATLLILVLSGTSAIINSGAADPCKLYIASKVYNLTGLKEHEDLNITSLATEEARGILVVSSIMFFHERREAEAQRYPLLTRRDKFKYTPRDILTPPMS